MQKIVVNKSDFDQFTLVHFGSGVLSNHLGFTFMQTLVGGFVWDYAIEPELKRQFKDVFPYPSQDAPAHKWIDALTPAVGWLVYEWWMKGKA